MGAGTSQRERGRRSDAITSINITPLCDILLVLLIIFMVASTHIVAETLKVDLPKASSSDGPSTSPNILSLDSEGQLLWNGKPIEEQGLRQELKSISAAEKDSQLVLSADKQVPHGRVVHLMDLAKSSGVHRFAINVERPR